MARSISDIKNPLECSICLSLFKDPVTTSCGHSFCKRCIEPLWNMESVRQVFSCPACRETFMQRPALSKSTALAGILEERKQDVPARPGDVQCDVCKGRKFKAVKSCLVCLASFCETHLQPHCESEALKKHELVNALPNLQQHICPQHHKALEIYCHDDNKCICVHCLGQHSGHKTVSAATEMSNKKEEVKNNKREITQLITDIGKNQAFRKAADSHKRSAQAAMKHSDRIFTELIQSLKRKRTEIRGEIRAHERRETQQTDDYIQNREQEISNLQNQSNKLGQILHTENHIHFFQNYSSHHPTPFILPKEVHDLTTFEEVNQSVSELKSLMEEHMVNISYKVTQVHIIISSEIQTEHPSPSKDHVSPSCVISVV